MKHIHIVKIYALALGLLLVVGACKKKPTDSEAMQTPEIEVATPLVDSVTLHKTYPGVVQSAGSVDVMARVNGTLIQKCFREGDKVSKGQVLFRIENTQYANAVREAEAALATARSQADYYRQQHAAMQRALAADAVSKMNVLEAESNLRQAEASIKNAEASLSDAKTQLGYCTVTAPISGTVSETNMDVGSYVGGAGSPATLCRIVNNSNLKVLFSIDDVEYQHLMTTASSTSAGKALFRNVPLSFSDSPNAKYTTDLYYVAPSVNTSTGSLTLEGHVNDPSGLLRDGMYVTVDLPTGISPNAILISDSSIGTDQLGKYVYLVNDSNRVVYTPIKVGSLYHDSLRIVTDGIKPSDRYVTKALLTVRNGEAVKPVATR